MEKEAVTVRQRKPVQMLLAFYGSMVVDQDTGPIPASLLLEILEGAGVAPATTRASLNRMASRGLLSRIKSGRSIAYGLTDAGAQVLREAAGRVNRERPFDPHGSGWTLVTFSVPEGQRTLRHRLRATLTWAGFAPLRDGLWVAPGAIDLDAALRPIHDELPAGMLTAFMAQELDGFGMGDAVGTAWDLESIRQAHEDFAAEWREPGTPDCEVPAMTHRTALVADWLALLRADPGLPPRYLDNDWPSDESTYLFRTLRKELEVPSNAELSARIG